METCSSNEAPPAGERRHLPRQGDPGAWSICFETPFGVAGASGFGVKVVRIQLPGLPGAATGKPFEQYGDRATRSEMKRALESFASGNGPGPDFELPWSSPFDRQVLMLIASVRRGSVVTYGGIAKALGKPSGSRAVGGAAGRNPLPILIPCHRVVGSNGRLTGFSARGGLDLKRIMLETEGIGFLDSPEPRVKPCFFCCLTPQSKRL